MQSLRNAHTFSRLMLVWFALFLGVAIASPIVSPQSTQLVCTGSGAIKAVTSGSDSSLPIGGHILDCPLCSGVGAPPPLALVHFETVQPLAYALQSIASAHIASATAVPPPARGPPTYL
jgi:hypothetical protein